MSPQWPLKSFFKIKYSTQITHPQPTRTTETRTRTHAHTHGEERSKKEEWCCGVSVAVGGGVAVVVDGVGVCGAQPALVELVV